MSDATKTGTIVRFEPDGFGVVQIEGNRFGWFANSDVAPGVIISQTSVGSTVAFDVSGVVDDSPHLTDIRILRAN